MNDWMPVNFRIFSFDDCGWWLNDNTLKKVFYVIIFSKASVIVNVFKQNNDQNISAITSKQANMFQLLISIQIFFKISWRCHDIDESIDVTTGRALRYARSQIHIALTLTLTLMLRNELYLLQFMKN